MYPKTSLVDALVERMKQARLAAAAKADVVIAAAPDQALPILREERTATSENDPFRAELGTSLDAYAEVMLRTQMGALDILEGKIAALMAKYALTEPTPESAGDFFDIAHGEWSDFQWVLEEFARAVDGLHNIGRQSCSNLAHGIWGVCPLCGLYEDTAQTTLARPITGPCRDCLAKISGVVNGTTGAATDEK